MTELNVKYPATQKAPEPSGPGLVIHSYIDVTPHQGEEVHRRYVAAQTEEEKDAVLRDMPRATVTFYELPEGEPFFDMEGHPLDKNGYALWNNVWVMDAANLGTIEALHGDEYDVQLGDELVRLTPDKFKHLRDLTEEEDALLQQLAEEERAVARAP
jgi:hypothetical protein